MLIGMFDEQIVNKILVLLLSSCAAQDKLMWMASKSGTYSMKSAHNTACKQHLLSSCLVNYGIVFGV